MIVRTQLSWYNIVQILPFSCANIVRTEMSIVYELLYEHCMNKIEQYAGSITSLIWFASFDHKTHWSCVHAKCEDVYLIVSFTFGKMT